MCSDYFAGRVVLYVTSGYYSPLHDGSDALSDAAGCLRLARPDRGEQVDTRDGIDLDVAETRQGLPFKCGPPVGRMLAAAPARAVQFIDCSSGRPQSGDLAAALPCQRIASVGDGRAVQRRRSGLGQGDVREAAETKVPALTLDSDSLDPRLAAGGFHKQIKAAAIARKTGSRERVALRFG